MANKNLQKLFSKPMDRREFLAHIGAGVLVVTGFSGLLKSLLDFNAHKQVSSGYGSSTYGGDKKA